MGVKALHRSMLAHMHVAAKTMAAVAAAGALVLTIVEMDGRLQSACRVAGGERRDGRAWAAARRWTRRTAINQMLDGLAVEEQ